VLLDSALNEGIAGSFSDQSRTDLKQPRHLGLRADLGAALANLVVRKLAVDRVQMTTANFPTPVKPIPAHRAGLAAVKTGEAR
jgi:hypothetical protein